MTTKLILDGDDLHAVTTQDVEPIIEANATERGMDWRRPKDEFARKVATVPNVIILQWLYEEYRRGNTGLRYPSAEFNALVWRKLQDPDWKYLRVDK